MELVKKDIHMNRMSSRQELQVTLDYDYNVPDIKPDVDKIIRQQGSIIVAESKLSQNRYNIEGNLSFSILYVSHGNNSRVCGITGKLPFSESMVWDEPIMDEVNTKAVLEDLSVVLVNSRKLNIRCIVTFICEGWENKSISVGVDAKCTDEGFSIEKRFSSINISKLKVSTKDIFRVRHEMPLPAISHNISEIMYSDAILENYDVRLAAGQINLNGNLSVFALYSCENEEMEYMDKDIPFDGNIEVPGIDDEMIDDIQVQIQDFEVNVKQDADRENRIIEAEVVLSLNIKAYEEEQLELLQDCYSTEKELNVKRQETMFESIAMKNTNKFKISDKMKLSVAAPPVLLICKSFGEVKVDGMEVTDEGVKVWGALELMVMYVSEEEGVPVNSVKEVFPYSQLIEMRGVNKESDIRYKSNVDNVSVNVMDARNLEIKAQISLSVIAFNPINENVITECIVNEEMDTKRTQLPEIVGYMASDGECLWDVAKRFNTTMDNIKKINNLDREMLRQGDRLIIVTQ